MAISAPQRKLALNEVLVLWNQPGEIDRLLPGVSRDTILNALASGLGTNVDAQLTTIAANKVTQLQTAISDRSAGTTTLNNLISTWTVT